MSLRVLTALSGALVAVFLAQLGAPHARSTVDRAPLSQLMRRPGPVPDYAPMAAVWTHPQLMTIGAALPGALDEILHDRHQVDDYNPPKAEGDYVEGQVEDEQDGTLVWLRDYQPIYVRDK